MNALAIKAYCIIDNFQAKGTQDTIQYVFTTDQQIHWVNPFLVSVFHQLLLWLLQYYKACMTS